jgi:hypothetical protein
MYRRQESNAELSARRRLIFFVISTVGISLAIAHYILGWF